MLRTYESKCPVRPELPPMPDRIAKLPVDARGYPVPWFVAWVDGKPEFRAADGGKRIKAVTEKRCWVCGDLLGVHYAFVIGPMCAINRVSSEPPSHLECALWSVEACPFLARPHMRRREGGMPEQAKNPGGVSILRNPGVSLVWVTKNYRVVGDGQGGWLIQVGEPRSVTCFAEGRVATLDEIRESVDSGFPLLMKAVEGDGPDAVRQLDRQRTIAEQLLGIGA